MDWVRSALPLLLTHGVSGRALTGACVSAPWLGQVRGLIDSGTETQRCLPRQHRFQEERRENAGKKECMMCACFGGIIVFTLERCDRCLGNGKRCLGCNFGRLLKQGQSLNAMTVLHPLHPVPLASVNNEMLK